MCIMVYIPDISFRHVDAITKVKKSKNDKRHWNEVDEDSAPWIKKYAGKNYRRNSPGGAKGFVIIIVLIF